MELGYARVSTQQQDLDRQITALTEHGLPSERTYADTKTGAGVDRPQFAELLRNARDGDTLVACTLDRLGRNLRECLDVVHDLRERGVGVKTLSDPLPIDSSDTELGEAVVALLAMCANMELVFRRERAAHARCVAEAKGKHPGRPRKLDDRQVGAAQAAIAAGQSPDDVAAAFGVSRATLYRHVGTGAEHTT